MTNFTAHNQLQPAWEISLDTIQPVPRAPFKGILGRMLISAYRAIPEGRRTDCPNEISCSQYGMWAAGEFGTASGLALAVKRIRNCGGIAGITQVYNRPPSPLNDCWPDNIVPRTTQRFSTAENAIYPAEPTGIAHNTAPSREGSDCLDAVAHPIETIKSALMPGQPGTVLPA